MQSAFSLTSAWPANQSAGSAEAGPTSLPSPPTTRATAPTLALGAPNPGRAGRVRPPQDDAQVRPLGGTGGALPPGTRPGSAAQVITATREPAREARDGADGGLERAEPIQREVVTFPAEVVTIEVVTFPAEVVTFRPRW